MWFLVILSDSWTTLNFLWNNSWWFSVICKPLWNFSGVILGDLWTTLKFFWVILSGLQTTLQFLWNFFEAIFSDSWCKNILIMVPMWWVTRLTLGVFIAFLCNNMELLTQKNPKFYWQYGIPGIILVIYPIHNIHPSSQYWTFCRGPSFIAQSPEHIWKEDISKSTKKGKEGREEDMITKHC